MHKVYRLLVAAQRVSFFASICLTMLGLKSHRQAVALGILLFLRLISKVHDLVRL